MAYTTDAQLDLEFGASNVTTWADIDNDGNATTIANRKANAIADADAMIDAYLLDGPYEVPFTATIPIVIQKASTLLAGYNLYMARGITDADPAKNEMKWAEDKAMKIIHMILGGKLRLNKDRSTKRISRPAAASDYDSDENTITVFEERL